MVRAIYLNRLTIWALQVTCSMCGPGAVASEPGTAIAVPVVSPHSTQHVAPAPQMAAGRTSLDFFLDRLMLAESGGRDTAKNPRSTAVGPFQFIEATWLDLMRRKFPAEAGTLTPAQLLALRTDRAFSRRVAEVYTRENATALRVAGQQPTYGYLRLAFFAGSGGANKVLNAAPDARVLAILGPGVGKANPFLFGMTVRDLIRRMGRDVGALAEVPFEGPPPTAAELEALQAALIAQKVKSIPKPFIIRCNQALAACKRWVALAEARGKSRPVAQRAPQRVAAPRPSATTALIQAKAGRRVTSDRRLGQP